MKLALGCWLLFALAAPTALAQTHPKQPAGKHAVGRQRAAAPLLRADVVTWPAYPAERSACSKRKVVETFFDTTSATYVYTYAAQMPALPGAGGMAEIVTALRRRVLVPPTTPAGRVFVQFIVTKAGLVSQPHVLKGLRADVDSAVVAAVRQLPRFAPGKHHGRPVPVRLTLPVAFQ